LYIIINSIKSIALLGGLEGCELLGAAGSVVEKDVGELVDWDARSVVEDVLGVARSAGSVGVEGLAEGVD
jgi:hypothetical protein